MNTDEHRWGAVGMRRTGWREVLAGSARCPSVFICVHLWFRSQRLATQSGHALLTTMLAAACLLPLGAFAAMQARLDCLVQHHTRTALETFTVAESGLAHALADVAADPRFERLLAGPDRQVGTGDDGEYPFAVAPPASFPHAPFRYDVRVAQPGADLLHITARGLGPFGATRAVMATVVRSAEPFVPAALALGARDITLTLGGDFGIAGLMPSASDAGLPAVGIEDSASAAALAAQLPADAAARLVGRGGTPSIAGTAMPSVEALADLAAGRADAQLLTGDVQGALGDGLFVSPGSLRLTDVSGSGVLVAKGALDLSGSTSFSGLVLALGDVRADLGSDVAIDGAMMVGRMGTLLSLRGAGHIAYDARVLQRVDAAFPGFLPRRLRVTGWRESFDAAG